MAFKLNLNKNTDLEQLDCRENKLTSLDVTKNTKLKILDCSDNFTTRYLVNKTCVNLHQPLVSAATIGFSGQLAGFSVTHR